MECLVEYDYTATHADELSMKKGDIIKNAIHFEDGWKKGWLNGKEGVFPDNFVKVLKSEMPKTKTTITKTDEINSKFDGLTQLIEDPKKFLNDNSSSHRIYTTSRSPVTSRISSKDTTDLFFTENISNSVLSANMINQSKQIKIITDQIEYGRNQQKPEIPSTFNSFSNIPKEQSSVNNVYKDNSTVVAIFNYQADNPDEISLEIGETIKVLDKNLLDDGWWRGLKENGEIGIFPSNFVQSYADKVSLALSQKKAINDSDQSLRIIDNCSFNENSNVSASASFNDIITGRKPSSKSIYQSNLSKFTTVTKNINVNSVSLDSLSDSKSKHSQENRSRNQSTINNNFKFPLCHHERSKADELSLSMERNKISNQECNSASKEDYCVLKYEFDKFKQEVEQKLGKLSIRIQTLVDEMDDEKKQRAASEIELIRLRRIVHMLDGQMVNGYNH